MLSKTNYLNPYEFPFGQETHKMKTRKVDVYKAHPEMQYCVSAASMLAEEIWQIVEGFVDSIEEMWKKFSV